MLRLTQPIAVFDAGIGSYGVVAEIQRQYPRQDVLYFADRASFPYGAKGRAELLLIMQRTIDFLNSFNPSAIVIASNAPSIMVLDDLRGLTSTPLFGIFPPIQEALARSSTGRVGVMGVRSLVESSEFSSFVTRQSADAGTIVGIEASDMVELVESGEFLFDPQKTQSAVDQFCEKLTSAHPLIDVLTLSSTHLPWLRPFFEHAIPKVQFLDPAQAMVANLPGNADGRGLAQGLVTEDETYSLADFQKMLARIGVKIPLESVTVR